MGLEGLLSALIGAVAGSTATFLLTRRNMSSERRIALFTSLHDEWHSKEMLTARTAAYKLLCEHREENLARLEAHTGFPCPVARSSLPR
jgi:hypothetical protein